MGQVNALPFFSVMAETKVKTAFLQQAGDWSDQGPVIQHKSARTAEEILGILDCAEGGGECGRDTEPRLQDGRDFTGLVSTNRGELVHLGTGLKVKGTCL